MPLRKVLGPLGAVLLLAGGAGMALAAPVVLSVDRQYREPAGRLAEAGEILLTELRCVNCHAAPAEWAERVAVLPGPRLEDFARRGRSVGLVKWLEVPHALKPGTTMPDLLHGLPTAERRSRAEALAAFLLSLSASAQPPGGTGEGNPENGRALFHSIGCVACHAPRPDFTRTAVGEEVEAATVQDPSVSLAGIEVRYTPGGLADFLSDPARIRPAHRMPSLGLKADEARDLAAYLLPVMGTQPGLVAAGSPEKVAEGRRLFSALGCAACHGLEGLVSNAPAPAPLNALKDFKQGCLSVNPPAGVPLYRLDVFQMQALAAALQPGRNLEPLSMAEKVHRRMTALNCYACHQRNQQGGPTEERLKYFVSSGSDLGDEGRVPPLLGGVGRKIQPDALVRVIQGAFPIRPYMTTRMPDFGETHARELALTLGETDADPDEQPTPRDGEENQVGRNMWGRALVGTEGLNCITCHRLNKHRSLGIQALDLKHSPRRLRPEWFRDYLIDPAAFRPGTRMPSFWPEGKPLLKGNGNSTSRQIDSIWVYLNEVDQSRLPVGLENKGRFLLTPKDRPIVFRTFMEKAGIHAIAVGYPAGLHVAFDSAAPRWAVAWQGKFLDAESTWDDRFTPLAQPQGKAVVDLQPLPPRQGGSDAAVIFQGYRLEKDGVPVMLYRVGTTGVEDRVSPDSEGARRLRRVLKATGSGPPVWLDVASGAKITSVGDARWSVGGKLTVSATADARVQKGSQGLHLQVQVNPDSEKEVLYEW